MKKNIRRDARDQVDEKRGGLQEKLELFYNSRAKRKGRTYPDAFPPNPVDFTQQTIDRNSYFMKLNIAVYPGDY